MVLESNGLPIMRYRILQTQNPGHPRNRVHISRMNLIVFILFGIDIYLIFSEIY